MHERISFDRLVGKTRKIKDVRSSCDATNITYNLLIIKRASCRSIRSILKFTKRKKKKEQKKERKKKDWMLERVVQALKTRLFRAKYPKLASPLRNYSQFLYFFPSTSNFSSSFSAYRAICPNFVTARSQLTEQMNRNAAKGSELIREFDKTRSLSRQFHG